MLSTHWSQPHEPSERDLRNFDILARQAADLIERSSAMEALRARTAQLIEADQRKDEFLATLAHELRNPLAPMRTGLALLLARKADAFDRVVPMMERQLGHMVRLIDDLLDVSRVSRGKVKLRKERVSLRNVIDGAIETSRPLLEAGRHRFEVAIPDSPLWLDADTTRLAQVLSNILDNAAKYTVGSASAWPWRRCSWRCTGDRSGWRATGRVSVPRSSSGCRSPPVRTAPWAPRVRTRSRLRRRAIGSSSSTTTWTAPKCWRCSWKRRGTRRASSARAPRPSQRRWRFDRTSCSSTSECPSWTDSTSPGGCGKSPGSSERPWWRSPDGAARRPGTEPAGGNRSPPHQTRGAERTRRAAGGVAAG